MPKEISHFLSLLFFFTFLFARPLKTQAQADQVAFKKSHENRALPSRSYDYEVELYQIQRKYHFTRTKGFNGLIQTLYGRTTYSSKRSRTLREQGHEGGLVLGLSFDKALLFNILNLYSFLGIGPYYISEGPQRQRSGLLFSDNLGLGAEFCPYSKFCFVGEMNFRHLSNAGLRKPNGGLNSFLINIGFNFR